MTDDVERFITRRFDASDREAAAALVASATIHDGSVAEARLLRCAVVASGGSLQTLQTYIDLLKIDWRDVIVAGEYAPRGGKLVRVRNLHDPIADDEAG
jgi:hypothetical protein